MKGKPDLKNSNFDMFAFIVYHLLAIGGSVFLLISLTSNLEEFKLNLLNKKKAQARRGSGPASSH